MREKEDLPSKHNDVRAIIERGYPWQTILLLMQVLREQADAASITHRIDFVIAGRKR